MGTGLFAILPDSDRSDFESFFEKVSVKDGTTICEAGEKGKEMFLILSGRVEVQREKRKEGEHEVAANLEEGQIAGEAALAGNYERNATLVARGETEILVITMQAFSKMKKDRPELAFIFYDSVIAQIVTRFRSVSNKKDAFSFWLG